MTIYVIVLFMVSEWVVDTEIRYYLVEAPVWRAPALLLGVARVVEGYAEVYAQGGDGDGHTQAEAGAYGNLRGQAVPFYVAVGILLRGAEEPHVAHVGEDGTLEDACYGEAAFDVHDKLQVANTLYVGHLVAAAAAIAAGAEAPQLPGAHGGGSAAEEAFFVGQRNGVAVGQPRAEDETRHEARLVAEVVVVCGFQAGAHILRERHPEDLAHVVLVGLGMAQRGHSGQQVAGGLHREVQGREVVACAVVLVAVGVVVARVEDEVAAVLVFEAQVVDLRQARGKPILHVYHAHEGHLYGQQLVAGAPRVAPGVTEGGVGKDALEVVAILVASAGREEGVGLDALEDDVACEGQQEYRHVKRYVETGLEGGEVVVEGLADVAEHQLGELEQRRPFDPQQLCAAKEVFVLVFYGCLYAQVAAGEEVLGAVVAAQRGGVGELHGERYLLLRGPDEPYVGVDERQRVGGCRRRQHVDIDVLEVAQAEERVVGVVDVARTVGHAGEDHQRAADGPRFDGHRTVVYVYVVYASCRSRVGVYERVVCVGGVAQAGVAVGIDVYVVDVVDLQVAAVYMHVDAQARRRVCGVDHEMYVFVGCQVIACFAQVGGYPAALKGYFLLVVGLADNQRRVVLQLVENTSDGRVLCVVYYVVYGVAVGGLDVVADADIVAFNADGVEAYRAAETAFGVHELLQLSDGLLAAPFVVDDGSLPDTVHAVVPQVRGGVGEEAVDPLAEGQAFDAEEFGVGTLQVVFLGVLDGVFDFWRHGGAAVGHLHVKGDVVQHVLVGTYVFADGAAGQQCRRKDEGDYMCRPISQWCPLSWLCCRGCGA